MLGLFPIGRYIKRETKPNDYDETKRLTFLGITEEFNDRLIPKPSDLPSPKRARITENGPKSNPGKKGKHNLDAERKRTQKINEGYSELKSMVPSLVNTFKPTKEQIVDNTIKYIKHLEEESARLERQKKLQIKQLEAAKQVLSKCSNPNVPVKVTAVNDVTFLAVQRSYQRRLLTKILMVFQKHRARVLEARIDVSDHWILTFTATLMLAGDGGSEIQKIREEILAL